MSGTLSAVGPIAKSGHSLLKGPNLLHLKHVTVDRSRQGLGSCEDVAVL